MIIMGIFNQKIHNSKLRKCQTEAYNAILEHFAIQENERSVLVQLPTGTGKSALIAVAPFNLATKKVLILTPNVKLAKQIEKDLDLTGEGNIYRKLELLSDDAINNLELYTLRLEGTVNHSDIDEHHILIANYHQLQDIEKWFKNDREKIDLIIIDEAHHQEADTYQEILKFFSNAKIIGLTATPFRSDGKKLEGKVIYKYNFHEAINDGVIRNVNVINVSPKEVELLFTDENARNFSLEEILGLKEESWFNRGIALSQDCCDSIAEKAKEKLSDLKRQFPKTNHQIIASAISKRHAREYVKPAFEKIGLKVGMVSSDPQDKKRNDSVFNDLEYGKIEVIVHIGMLGEGFDHPQLGVAAIFRPYKSLNPYIQFLGRVIRRNEDATMCFVVSHIGLNQIRRFQEFKMFDYEDKEFLEKLLSEESEQKFVNGSDSVKKEENENPSDPVSIREIGNDLVNFESHFVAPNKNLDSLIAQVENLAEEEKKKFFEKFGINIDTKMSVVAKKARLKPVDKRKAARILLYEREKSIAVDTMKALSIKHKGRNFNKKYENFVWIKRYVSKSVNAKLGINSKQRQSLNNEIFETMNGDSMLEQVRAECLTYFSEKLPK